MNEFLARIHARVAAQPHAKSESALHRLYPHLSTREHLFSLNEDEISATRVRGGYPVAVRDYASQVWVHKAVGLIADAIAPLPLRVVDRDNKPVENHPLTMLFEHVNGNMSPSDLWKWWATDMLLGGENGLELSRSGNSGKFVEITPRQPQMITVVADKALRRYYVPAGYKIRVTPEDDPIVLAPEEFVFSKLYNPANPWRGLAPIEAVRMGIVIDQLAQAWSRLFFSNSARPDFAVIAPEGMTKTEKDDLEAALMQQFGGVGNAHKAIVLEEGVVDVKPFSFPPKDIEWLEQRKMSRQEIGAVFGVPDEMMGFGVATFSNFETAREVLWTLTLVPLVGMRDSVLTEHFQGTGDLTVDQRFDTDLSRVPELQEDFNEKLDQALTLTNMGVPFDTVNQRLGLGFEDIPGGALPVGAAGNVIEGGVDGAAVVIDTDANSIKEEKPQIFGYHIELGVVGRNEAREAMGFEEIDTSFSDGQTVLQQQLTTLKMALDARVDPEDAKKLAGLDEVEIVDPCDQVCEASGEAFGLGGDRNTLPDQTKQAFPVFGSEDHISHMKRLEERQEPFVVTMRRELKRQFQRQQNDVLRELRSSNRTLGRGRTPDDTTIKEGAGDLFNIDDEIKRFIEDFRGVVTGMVERSGELEAERLGTSFDIDRPQVQAAIEAILKDFATKVNNTTFNEMVTLFEQAEAAGESIAEIQERLNAFFGGRKSDFETERIARTTMVAADNQGAIESYEQSGEVAEKIWLATLDDSTRDAHINAHGQKVALAETFTVGADELRFPGDPQGAPGNIINCRCAVAPVLN